MNNHLHRHRENQLAQLARIAPARYAEIMAGRIKYPSLPTGNKICRALKDTLAELVAGRSTAPAHNEAKTNGGPAPDADLSALRQQMVEAGRTADEALAHLKAQTSAAGIGADIKRMLGQNQEEETLPRKWTPEERNRAYAAALRPDPINRKSLHHYEFRVRYGGL